MMTERQRKISRAVSRGDQPLLQRVVHIGVMYTAGIAGIWYCVSQLQNATLGVAAIDAGADRRQLRRVGACTSS